MQKKCPECGSEDILKRGFLYSRSGKLQRYQCKKCGRWFSEPSKRDERLFEWAQEEYRKLY